MPFNGILKRAPFVEQAVTPALGSAPGFFQPLSGFLASPSSTALFHAVTVPELSPSELSPREGRVPLSRPLAPLRLSTEVQKRVVAGLIASGFTDFHAFAQSPGSPRDYGFPFCMPKPASRSPWTADGGIAPYPRLHPLRSVYPSTSPFAKTRVTPSLRPILSRFLPPLKTEPLKPATLKPATPRKARRDDVRERRSATGRTSSPSRRVKLRQCSKTLAQFLWQHPIQYGPDRTASRRHVVLS
jgi:hypothetical protein